MEVDRSDLEKLRDPLVHAVRHHKARDVMNAELHLARETRWSPITSELEAALDRLDLMLGVTMEKAAASYERSMLLKGSGPNSF